MNKFLDKFLAIFVLSGLALGCADCVQAAFYPLEVLIGAWVRIYGILPIFIAVFSFAILFPVASSPVGEADKTKELVKPVLKLGRILTVGGLFTIYILVSFLPLSFVKAIPFNRDVIANVVTEHGVIEQELGFKVCFQSSKVLFLRGEGRESRVQLIIAEHSRGRGVNPEIAAAQGDLNLLKELEGRGMSLDFQDPRVFNRSPLMAAILVMNTNVIEYLLEKKVNLNLEAQGGMTALMYAEALGDTNIINMLLVHGAQPSFKNHYGNTAFDAANGNSNILHLLKVYDDMERNDRANSVGQPAK